MDEETASTRVADVAADRATPVGVTWEAVEAAALPVAVPLPVEAVPVEPVPVEPVPPKEPPALEDVDEDV